LLTLNYDLSFPLPMLSPGKPPAKEK